MFADGVHHKRPAHFKLFRITVSGLYFALYYTSILEPETYKYNPTCLVLSYKLGTSFDKEIFLLHAIFKALYLVVHLPIKCTTHEYTIALLQNQSCRNPYAGVPIDWLHSHAIKSRDC